MVKLTYCGDDCYACPKYFFNLNGDTEKSKQVAELWYRCGWTDTVVSPEEIACKGCYPEKSCRYGINKCASQKGVENCGECDNYPCEKIKAAFEGTQAYADRCKEICTAEEYMILDKAFFSKKQRLDEVNMQCKKQRNCGLSDRIDI